MPKIAATSIDEHVQMQLQRIIAAAKLLFSEQGFHGTDIGDIAREVGLARNSLYRYFANKDELLLACVKEDMEPHMQRLAELSESYPDPVERMIALVTMQFELATGPEHATMELMSEVRDGSRQLRNDVEQMHSAPNKLLKHALTELYGSSERVDTRAAMISGIVMSTTAHALQLPKSEQSNVHAEMLGAIQAIFSME